RRRGPKTTSSCGRSSARGRDPPEAGPQGKGAPSRGDRASSEGPSARGGDPPEAGSQGKGAPSRGDRASSEGPSARGGDPPEAGSQGKGAPSRGDRTSAQAGRRQAARACFAHEHESASRQF